MVCDAPRALISIASNLCLDEIEPRRLYSPDSNPLEYSCLENPMNKDPGGLQSIGSKRL